MADPGDQGAAPSAPLTALDWRHLACAAHANNLPAVSQHLAAGIQTDPEDGNGVTALHWACFNGNQQMVEQLVTAGADVNPRTDSGRTPLHLALLGGHSSIVHQLIAAKADVNASSSRDGPPLAIAISRGDADLVSRLLAAGADPNISWPTAPTSLLMRALTLGHEQMATMLLEQGPAAGADIVDDAEEKRTALHLAAEHGSSDLVTQLLERGVPVNAKDCSGATPLLAAVIAGHYDVAAQLAAAGADCNIRDNLGLLPLHAAAQVGNLQLVTALLAAGAMPQKFVDHDRTPLHLAAAAGHGDLVTVLLAALAAVGRGADVCATSTCYTALQAAAAAGHHEVVQQLAAAGADVNKARAGTEATPLYDAIEARSPGTVAALLAAGADPNAVHAWGTPLLLAVRSGVSEVIPVLVEGGADIHHMSPRGKTALHLAVCCRQHVILEQLLDLGADVGASSNRSGTALHCTVRMGDAYAVRLLAAAPSAPLDATLAVTTGNACWHVTALDMAVRKDAGQLVEALIAAGADVNKRNSSGRSPLYVALTHGHTSVVEQLLAAGADVNAVSEDKGSLLAVAVQLGNQDIQQLLLAAGADPTLGSKDVPAPLMTAVMEGNKEFLQRLLAAPAISQAVAMKRMQKQSNTAAAAAGACGGAAGTDAEHADRSQPSHSSSGSILRHMGRALRAAVRMEAPSEVTVGMLLEAGAPPNSQGTGGAAALHLAMSGVAHSAALGTLVGRLLAAGADPNLVSDEHGTPLGMAVAARDGELVERLLVAGALPDQVPPGRYPALITAAKLGEADIAGQLLDAGADVNATDWERFTPLHHAAIAGHVPVVQRLVKRGAQVNFRSNWGTPLQAAVCETLKKCFGTLGLTSETRQAVVSALLAAGADVNAADGDFRWQPVALAASSGQLQLVKLLVAAGATLNVGKSQSTALQLAVAAESLQVVQVLLEAGASPNICGSGTRGGGGHATVAFPLEMALGRRQYAIAAALLAAGADPNARHSSGCGSLLHDAVDRNNLEVVEQLLAAAASPNVVSAADGITPLQLAVRRGHKHVAERLLKAGASPNVVCPTRRIRYCTPLQEALVYPPRPDLALQLLEAGADPNLGKECDAGMPLQLAVTLEVGGPDRIDLVEALLAAGAEPNGVGGLNSATPLQLAVRHNLCQVAKLLLKKGADASVVDSSSGDTLLHVAVRSNFSYMVGLLERTSADVNAANNQGDTPLLMTMQARQTDWTAGYMHLLCSKRLDPNARDSSGCSALHHAARRGEAFIIKILLQSGADPSATDKQGRMALHLAAEAGCLEAVQLLAPQGMDISSSSSSSSASYVWTPLQLAARGAYEEVVKWLLGTGAGGSVSAAKEDGITALHLACARPGTERMVKHLLAAGAAPGGVNSHGNTPVHLAAAAGEGGSVRRLLAAGAHACKRNGSNELPLHLALAGGHTAVAQQLIAAANTTSQQLWVNTVSAAGVALIHLAAAGHSSLMLELLGCQGLEVDIVDGAGQTAVHKAAAAGKPNNLRLLVQHGASVGVADAAGATPLHLAAAGRFSKCMRRLVSAGADKDAVDGNGATPLHRAGLAISHEVAALLATPNNSRKLVGGTTLLHQAAANGRRGWVTALLAAGAPAGQEDSRGESVLTLIARQGSMPMLSLLLRHLLWQHKLAAATGSALLPQEVVVAMQQALANSVQKSVLVFTTVMEVLGEGAATTLWERLAEQASDNTQQQQQQPIRHTQGQAQQQHGQQQQQQQQQQQGHVAVSALLQGFLDATQSLAEQQKGVMQPLQQALQTGRQHTPAAAATPACGRPLAAHAAAGLPVAGAFSAPARECKLVTITSVTTAAALGQEQKVQQLLLQLPATARTVALEEAARAAASSGHYQLCVLLLKSLAAVSRYKAEDVVQVMIMQWERCRFSSVKALGPRSMGLCAALLCGWQAVTRQQQEQLVDAVVSAVVVWQQEQQQQQVHGRRAGPRREKHRHVSQADQQRPVRGLWPMGAAAVLVQAEPLVGNLQDVVETGAPGNLRGAAGDVGGAADQQQEALPPEGAVSGDLPAAAGEAGGAGTQQQGAAPPPLRPEVERQHRRFLRACKQLV